MCGSKESPDHSLQLASARRRHGLAALDDRQDACAEFAIALVVRVCGASECRECVQNALGFGLPLGANVAFEEILGCEEDGACDGVAKDIDSETSEASGV